MRDPDDRITELLRGLADSLDHAAPAVTVDEAVGMAAPARPSHHQRLLIVAVGASFLALAGLLAWSTLDGADDAPTVGPGPTEAPTTIDGASVTELDWTALPDVGVAVQPLDGQLALYDLDGTPAGLAPVLTEPVNGPRLVANPGHLGGEPVSAAEVPVGCTAAEVGGGVRVALCGGSDGLPVRIDLVNSAGEARPLLDGLPASSGDAADVSGHWRWATPSPDGRWVLAQWSGECEVPQAVLVDVDTGAVRTIGDELGDDPTRPPETSGLGWGPDGRAVVQVLPGACGSGSSEPGVYALDPVTGALEEIVSTRGRSNQAFLWSKRAWGNGLEWLFTQAQRELGLDGCCGEPSHGGADVTAGAVFEGHDIGISGAPTGTPAATVTSSISPQLVDLLHGEAVVATNVDGAPFGSPLVGFTCGAVTWWLSWWEDDSPPLVDTMLALAEALVPRLGCTLGEPPDVMPHGDRPASAP